MKKSVLFGIAKFMGFLVILWGFTQCPDGPAHIAKSQVKNEAFYFDYVKAYGDTIVLPDATINTYDINNYNIDHIAPGPW